MRDMRGAGARLDGRDPLRHRGGMKIQTRAGIDIASPVERVFDLAVDMARVSELMTRVGPIPGVVSMEMLDGRSPGAGAQRTVTMSDGSAIVEEILALDRPLRHAYRWRNPPGPPFSLLVRGAEADWVFTARDGGARVDWTYTFTLTSFLAYPLAALVVMLFRRWMVNALERLKRAAAG